MSGPVEPGSPSAATADPITLLLECLNDPEPWEAEALVDRMEAVFVALGWFIDEDGAHV